MDVLVDTLKKLINISEQEIPLVRDTFILKHLKKGEHFLTEGNVCRQAALISKGLVRYYINDDGNEGTYYFGAEGDFMCDYESFLPQRPSNKNIQALEDTSLFSINLDGLQYLYANLREGERFGRLAIEMVFVTVLQQLTSFYRDSPEQRYQNFVRAYAGISQRVPQYYIASYIGIKPQSVSRIRKRTAHQH